MTRPSHMPYCITQKYLMVSKTTNLLRKKTGEGMALKQAEAKYHKKIRRRMKRRRREEIWRKRMRRKIIRKRRK